MPSLAESVLKANIDRGSEECIVGPNLSMTHGELFEDVVKAANFLMSNNIQQGDLVALSLSVETELVFLVALDWIGAASGIARNAAQFEQLDKLGFSHFIHSKPDLPKYEVKTILLTAGQLQEFSTGTELEIHSWDLKSIYRVLFTSGTTGKPKAVPLNKPTFDLRVERAKQGWLRRQPLLSLFGLDVSMTQLLFSSSLYENHKFFAAGDAEQAKSILLSGEISGVLASEAHLNQLLNEGAKNLEAVLRIVIGGSFPSPSLRDEIDDLFPNAEPYTVFGSAEAGQIFFTELQKTGRKLGFPLEGVRATIRQSQNSSDEFGYLIVEGDCLASGYLNEAEETRTHFHNGSFVSGDLVSVDDERGFFYQGRDDNVLNFGGKKIDAELLEQTIETRIPSIKVLCRLFETELQIDYESKESVDPEIISSVATEIAPFFVKITVRRGEKIATTSSGKKVRN